MTRLVDLTQPWGDRMPTWPQFASIEVTDITTHHRDRKSTMLVKTNMHTGTHIDAPSHYCETGRDLGRIGLDELYGTGLVLDLRPITQSLEQVQPCRHRGLHPEGREDPRARHRRPLHRLGPLQLDDADAQRRDLLRSAPRSACRR